MKKVKSDQMYQFSLIVESELKVMQFIKEQNYTDNILKYLIITFSLYVHRQRKFLDLGNFIKSYILLILFEYIIKYKIIIGY